MVRPNSLVNCGAQESHNLFVHPSIFKSTLENFQKKTLETGTTKSLLPRYVVFIFSEGGRGTFLVFNLAYSFCQVLVDNIFFHKSVALSDFIYGE